jgi:hypothetical protein
MCESAHTYILPQVIGPEKENFSSNDAQQNQLKTKENKRNYNV